MTSLASLLGSGIKSVQRGTISLTAATPATATIAAVNVNKAELSNLGANYASGIATSVRLELTNATTITATPCGSASSVVSWQIVERY